MNLKIIDKVKKSFCKHKKTIKGIVIAVIALLSVYSFMLPFSDGFHTALLRTKILGIGSTICGIVFFIIVIITTLKNAKKDKKYYYDILCASPLMLLEIVNIFMIFDCGFLGFKTIIVGISLISVLLIEIFISIRTLFHNSFGKENTPVVLLTLAIISCMFSLANLSTGNVEYAKTFAIICFGIAYLVAIALYTNRFIYKQKNPEKTISSIIGIVFWGAIITITFPFYINWCGFLGDSFNTFVDVYAAVLGGGITLAGVAWTIKDGNDKRKEDLDRVEMERKEDDRRKHRPIMHVYAGPYSGLKTDINVMKWLKNTEHISKEATEKLKVPNKIRSCYFGNTEFSNVYVWGIKLNGNITNFDSIRYIKKDSYFYLDFSDKPIYTEKTIETISLIIEDVLENLYELPLDFAYSKEFEWFTIVGNNPSFYIGKVDKGNIIYE